MIRKVKAQRESIRFFVNSDVPTSFFVETLDGTPLPEDVGFSEETVKKALSLQSKELKKKRYTMGASSYEAPVDISAENNKIFVETQDEDVILECVGKNVRVRREWPLHKGRQGSIRYWRIFDEEQPGSPHKTKQVIVIRKDLKMTRGKEIAQGSHASMAFITKGIKETRDSCMDTPLKEVEIDWLDSLHTKVTLQVNSLEELEAVYEAAKEADLEVNMVTDAGLTMFNGVPTKTCLAIGPDYEYRIDPITSKLKLY